MLAQKTPSDPALTALLHADEYLVVPSLEGPSLWEVIHTSGRAYRVDEKAGTCSCMDHQKRGRVCKHMHLLTISRNAFQMPTAAHPVRRHMHNDFGGGD